MSYSFTTKIKRRGRSLQQVAEELSREIPKAEAKSATMIIQSLKARVKDNVSHTGSGFKPLTPKYKKHKESKGLNERFVYSGKMLSQLRWKRIAGGVRLYFIGTGDTKAAAAHYKHGRPFLNVSRTEYNFLKRNLIKVLRRATR